MDIARCILNKIRFYVIRICLAKASVDFSPSSYPVGCFLRPLPDLVVNPGRHRTAGRNFDDNPHVFNIGRKEANLEAFLTMGVIKNSDEIEAILKARWTLLRKNPGGTIEFLEEHELVPE